MAYESRIESKELLVLESEQPKTATGNQRYGKKGYAIRVVQWLYEGKGENEGNVMASLAVEKRELFVDDEGVVKIGKAKGFTPKEYRSILIGRSAEINAAFDKAPAPAWPGLQPAAEEVGF